MITARQPRAADVDLAEHSHGDELQMPVQDVDARAGEGPADRHGPVRGPVRQRALEVEAVDRGLGQPVRVHDPCRGAGQAPEPLVHVRVPGVGADRDQPREVERSAARLQVRDQALDDGGDELGAVDSLADHQGVELGGIEQGLPGTRHQRPARAQRADPVPGEHVEGEAGHLQMAGRAWPERVGVLPGAIHSGQAGVRHHHALGRPRAARRVDDVGEVLRRRDRFRVVLAIRSEPSPVGVEADDEGLVLGDLAEEPALGQQGGNPGVVELERQALAGAAGSSGT